MTVATDNSKSIKIQFICPPEEYTNLRHQTVLDAVLMEPVVVV